MQAITYSDVARYQARPAHSVRAVAGSRSLASMLPALLTSGVITLVAAAVMRLMWTGLNGEFFGAWMEAWLTTWPIAFPVAYLSKPFVNFLVRRWSRPLVRVAPGLSVTDVMSVARRAGGKLPVKTRRFVPYY